MDVKPMNFNGSESIKSFIPTREQIATTQNINVTAQNISPGNAVGDDKPSESVQMLQEVLQISDTLNRKVKFFIDTDSNRVIVRIIDRETNEIIKELPPEALVKLHKKMKEAMGILGVFVDQKA